MIDLAGKRIFIVEDDVANMAVYTMALKYRGASVFQDYFSSNTLRMIKQFMPIDIILLDLMLRHGVSGYDIFLEIKADEELTDIPILAISASDPEIEIPRARAIGFSGFVSKPIQAIHLAAIIDECIKGQSIWLAESFNTY